MISKNSFHLKILSTSSLRQSLLKKLNSILMNQSRSCRQMFSNGLNYIFMLTELQIRKAFPSEVQNRPPAFEINVPKEMFAGLFYKIQPMLSLSQSQLFACSFKGNKIILLQKEKETFAFTWYTKGYSHILCLILVNNLWFFEKSNCIYQYF